MNGDDPQDPIKAKKVARWWAIRKEQPDLPRDSVTAMVRREFAASPPEAPAIDERVPDRPPLSIAQPAQDATRQQAVDRPLRAPPPESGVGIEGQSLLALTDAFNPFQDEIAGGIMAGGKAVKNFMFGRPVTEGVADQYRETRDAARAPVNEFAYYNPGLKTTEDIAAGFLTPPLFGPAKAGLGPMRRVARATALGATEGAAYGFAGAEGDVKDQSLRALLGGTIGGTMAGVTQGVGNAILRDPAGDIMARSAEMQGDAPLETLLSAVPSRVTAPDRPLQPLSPQMAPRSPTPPMTRQANGQMPPLPAQPSVRPQEPSAVTGMEAMGRTGRDLGERVARQGGEPARQVTEAAEAVASEGKPRLIRSAEDALQVHGEDPRKVLGELERLQAASDDVNYPAAYGPPEKPNVVKVTDKMRTVLEDPQFREAAQEYVAFANQSLDETTGALRGTPLPALYDDAGKLAVDQVPIEVIDKVKQGMDQVAQKKGASFAPPTAEQARDVKSKLRLLRSEADVQSPEYAKARKDHGIPETQAGALRDGLDVFKPSERGKGGKIIPVTPVSLARKLGKAEAADVRDGLNRTELFRVGAAYRVAQQIKRAGKLTPEAMERLDAILPEGADVRTFADAIQKEGDRANIAQLLRRLTDQPSSSGHDAGLASAAGNLAAGNTGRGTANLLTRGLDKLSGKAIPQDLPLRTRSELARRLSAVGPDAAAQADAALVKRGRLGRSVDLSTLLGRVAGREGSE